MYTTPWYYSTLGTICIIEKKTPPTRVLSVICSKHIVPPLQDWLLGFNCDKCKCLHLGKNNKKCQYTIQQNNKTCIMSETLCEKDLGVNIDSDLNFEEHIEIQTKKARGLSGMIMRTFVYKTAPILIPIFKSLIRPILEYGNVV